MKVPKIKVRGQAAQPVIHRMAMVEAALDPVRFGRQFRNRVQQNRKRQALAGYRKQKLLQDGE